MSTSTPVIETMMRTIQRVQYLRRFEHPLAHLAEPRGGPRRATRSKRTYITLYNLAEIISKPRRRTTLTSCHMSRVVSRHEPA